jgi:formylglycine-generating enzyme required for sulfatase activity
LSGAFDWLRSEPAGTGHVPSLLNLARELRDRGNLPTAATAYDRAHALDPENTEIAAERAKLLDSLAVVEHGIRFCFIPAGTFLMGDDFGDPDERPVHQVELNDFWLSETPLSWSTYCDLMGWSPPPGGFPAGAQRASPSDPLWFLHEANKIRLQYCEDATRHAVDWHAHAAPHDWTRGDGEIVGSRTLFGTPPREDPRRPWRYDRKPMVSIAWEEAEELCSRLASGTITYRLPTEAEWEKAARGGRAGARYPWGNAPPTVDSCDFNRFAELSILPMRRFPPNGYGLFSMSGSVWEWTRDFYDATYYAESPRRNPEGSSQGSEHVLRGGSWTDCEEAVTVSFRLSRRSVPWHDANWGPHFTPNIGFRICRTESVPPAND